MKFLAYHCHAQTGRISNAPFPDFPDHPVSLNGEYGYTSHRQATAKHVVACVDNCTAIRSSVRRAGERQRTYLCSRSSTACRSFKLDFAVETSRRFSSSSLGFLSHGRSQYVLAIARICMLISPGHAELHHEPHRRFSRNSAPAYRRTSTAPYIL